MKTSSTILDCGDPTPVFGLLPARGTAGGVFSLFTDRRVAYSFNTRVAIHRAVDILDLAPGDEVLAPAYNCGSELDPLLDAGLKVQLYPVNLRTEIDPTVIEGMIGPRTRAVYLTHYFGFLQPGTVAIRALCDAHGLRLIEDCALSLLSGTHPAEGRAGDVAVFCFYKFFPVVGGGALVVNAPDLPDPAPFMRPAPRGVMVRQLLRTGAEKVLGSRGTAALKRRLRGTLPGQAPVGGGRPDMPADYYFDPSLSGTGISRLTARALRGFDVAATIEARKAHYIRLLDRLQDITGLAPLFPDIGEGTVPRGMPVLIKSMSRDGLARALQAEGIGATPWWAGYNRRLDFTGHQEACALKDSVLFLPAHPWLEVAAIDHIASRVAALIRLGP
jgi:dTDP-4-amino-4,6-dideoxygalactose transaminase